MQGACEVAWCFPEGYQDCNNNSHGMCEALVGNCSNGEICPFYKSRKDTSDDEMKKYHKTRWRSEKKDVY